MWVNEFSRIERRVLLNREKDKKGQVLIEIMRTLCALYAHFVRT